MPSLKDLLEGDFGVEQVKTASAGSSEIDELAARYGFDFAKTASEHEDEESEEKEEKEEHFADKKASAGLSAYFSEIFPEDDDLSKTAEELEKVAYEENLGARAYDHFAARWDRRIEKIASHVLSGSSGVCAPTGADHDGNAHTEDLTIPQANETNRPRNAGEKIDTTPSYTDEIHSHDDARTIGHLEQKHAEDLAMRKALILSQLED